MIEWERVIKKGLAIAMSAMMAVTVLPNAVNADDRPVYVNTEVEGKDVSETVGDVSTETLGFAVDVSASNGHKATVNTGNLSNKTEMGGTLSVNSSTGGKTAVTTGSTSSKDVDDKYHSGSVIINSSDKGSDESFC